MSFHLFLECPNVILAYSMAKMIPFMRVQWQKVGIKINKKPSVLSQTCIKNNRATKELIRSSTTLTIRVIVGIRFTILRAKRISKGPFASDFIKKFLRMNRYFTQ